MALHSSFLVFVMAHEGGLLHSTQSQQMTPASAVKPAEALITWGYRLVFVVAKPREEAAFAALQEEAAATADTVVLPTIWEHYHNITHQTLEILRAAAVDPAVTHVLKVCATSYCSMGSRGAAACVPSQPERGHFCMPAQIRE